MRKINVGLVGFGRIGKIHAACSEQSNLANLIAVCDINKDALSEAVYLYPNVSKYESIDSLIEQEDIDCLHIATPHHLHVPMAKRAIQSNHSVILEKPIGIKTEDTASLETIVKQSNSKILVCFQNRMNETTLFAKTAIKDGLIGKLRGTRVVLSWYKDSDYYMHSSWKGSWEKEGGGVLIDQAIHSIDLVRYITDDELINITSLKGNITKNPIEVEDSFLVRAILKKGGDFLLIATNGCWENLPLRIEFYGDLGSVILDGDQCLLYNSSGIVDIVRNKKDKILNKGYKESYWGVKHFELITLFYKHILGIGKNPIEFIDAVKTQRIIEECYLKSN